MKISKPLFYIFVILFIAFALAFTSFTNDTMTEEEGGSRYWLMRIIFLLDMICVAAMVVSYKRTYRGIHSVCVLWIFVMTFVMVLNHAPIADTVRTILWPLLFETTYLCCQNREKRWRFLKIVYFFIAIIGFLYFIATRSGVDHQTNTIYLCFLTLPWLMFATEKKNTIIVMFIFTILTLLSMKRSVMLSMVLIWGFYFLYGMKIKRNKIVTITLSLFLLGGLYLAYDKIDAVTGGVLTDRVTKEETDEGKGREAIWAVTISMIQHSSPSELFRGHGHFGVRRDSFLEISAHNDFLEVIYDYGMIIFFLYLCLWVHVIRRSYKLYRVQSPIFLPYAASLSIFLVMSMVSHLILYTTYFNYLVMFWGMTEAYVELNHPELFTRNRIRKI